MSQELEAHFAAFAQDIIGQDAFIETPYGEKPLTYADWTATGRRFRPIDERMSEELGPFMANTHTEDNYTGSAMTRTYEEAEQIILDHVGANEDDVLIKDGGGATSAINRFQQILGWHVPERFASRILVPEQQRPVVFVSAGEHHSNHINWDKEGFVDVEIIPYVEEGIVSLEGLRDLLHRYQDRDIKVAAVTAGSNVTGIRPPIHDVAKLMHESEGHIFVDYTCAAPYDNIDMHPDDASSLDALFLSPHKFLGGQQTPGIGVFNKKFYDLQTPSKPGGGTVLYTTPYGPAGYYDSNTAHEITKREDGGTPPFAGVIQAALAVKLKEKMGLDKIAAREAEICEQVFSELEGVKGLDILAGSQKDRLPVFSLNFADVHYKGAVRLLNDRYGIQVRSGCACAGTYGHHLFNIGPEYSAEIITRIRQGYEDTKPGFTRVSLHPTMSSEKVSQVTNAIAEVATHGSEMLQEYTYEPNKNRYVYSGELPKDFDAKSVFEL